MSLDRVVESYESVFEWRKSQTISKYKPADYDRTSSKLGVYVRKNFTSSPVKDMEGNVLSDAEEKVWEYEEKIVPISDWTLFQDIFEMELTQESQDDMILNNDFRIMCLEEGISDLV